MIFFLLAGVAIGLSLGFLVVFVEALMVLKADKVLTRAIASLAGEKKPIVVDNELPDDAEARLRAMIID